MVGLLREVQLLGRWSCEHANQPLNCVNMLLQQRRSKCLKNAALFPRCSAVRNAVGESCSSVSSRTRCYMHDRFVHMSQAGARSCTCATARHSGLVRVWGTPLFQIAGCIPTLLWVIGPDLDTVIVHHPVFSRILQPIHFPRRIC